MANLPRLRSITRPAEDIKSRLETRTGLNNFAADSAAGTMSNALATAIVNNHNETVNAFEQMQISTASGKHLDQIAISHGVTRYEPRKAYSVSSERSMYFYVASGTFGDINSGNDITLPAGTKVYPGDGSESSILYETLEAYILPAGNNRVYCTVRAVSFGASQNVGPRTLTSHDLSSYSGLYCTNKYAIVNGRGREKDQALRDRLSIYFKTLSQNNKSSLLLQSLGVPGVIDLAVIEGYYGMGTCGVFVFGADGFSSKDLVRQVRTRAAEINTPGLRVIVAPGIQVALSFEMEVNIDAPLTSSQTTLIRAGIKRSIMKYISSGNVRREINIRDLRNFIISENPRLLSILPKKSLAKESLFKNVYVGRKYSGLDTGSIRETMNHDSYTLKPEEFAVLGSTDISIKVNV